MQIGLLYVILALIGSAVLTIIIKGLITKTGGNLYTHIRGGTPRAVGLAPFLVLILLFPPPGNYLIAIIGIAAFIDDLVGRTKIKGHKLEYGQLSRGIGMLLVMIIGYFYFGPVSILIALMIQPLNIADMQPGSACSTVIIMASIMLLGILALTTTIYYPILIVLAACIGYAPLDYRGRIMMGEIGNHSFGVSLGLIFASFGSIIGNYTGSGDYVTFIITLLLLLATTVLIAFIRRKNLKNFLENNYKIIQPRFGDYFMDVLTGGGFGDLFRRFIIKKKIITINNRLLILLGFRRLVHNPYSN
ncbi:MAG: cell wall biosynthesis protein [Methanobacterium sp.]|uniref:cell wall biosynthesis protein n=1 Tax=Methanobacterium sp. TaxID=2164 RepID=UPI003C793797